MFKNIQWGEFALYMGGTLVVALGTTLAANHWISPMLEKKPKQEDADDNQK